MHHWILGDVYSIGIVIEYWNGLIRSHECHVKFASSKELEYNKLLLQYIMLLLWIRMLTIAPLVLVEG